jgi:type II secretory pathway component PulF
MQAAGQTPLLTALVKAGETTSHLPELCTRIADHYDQLISLRSLVIGKLIYPALLIHLALMVPALPGVVLGEQPAYALLAGPGGLWLALLIAGIALWVTRRSGVLSRIALLPIISSLTRPYLTANTCLVLASATSAGMKVRDSLDLAAGACGNRVLGAQLQAGGKAVDNGTTPTMAAALTGAGFPSSTLALIDNGERAGSLEKTLDQAAIANRESFRLRLEWTTRTLLGLIYGIAMLLAAYTVVSMYSKVLGGAMQAANEAEQQ